MCEAIPVGDREVGLKVYPVSGGKSGIDVVPVRGGESGTEGADLKIALIKTRKNKSKFYK